jgi:hypothetical protein
MDEDKEWFSGRGVDEEPKRDLGFREFLILAAVAVILGMLAGCAAVSPQQEIPTHVYQDESKTIRLMPGPCVHPGVKGFIGAATPELAERFRAIESTWSVRDGTRKAFAGCWIEFTADEVGYEAFGLLFEDGERYLVNKAEFLAGKGQGT